MRHICHLYYISDSDYLEGIHAYKCISFFLHADGLTNGLTEVFHEALADLKSSSPSLKKGISVGLKNFGLKKVSISVSTVLVSKKSWSHNFCYKNLGKFGYLIKVSVSNKSLGA